MKNTLRVSKERVVFYLTKEDKEALNNKCKLLGIQTSFFIRNLVLESFGKPIFKTNKIPVELKKYMNELMKQGVNLNQIAKKLNQGEKFLIADQQKVLDSIKIIGQQILEVNVLTIK